MDIDIDVQTSESGIRDQGAQTPIFQFIGQGFFFLILRHETKVGRVFYLVIVIFLFLSSFNNFYLIPSI